MVLKGLYTTITLAIYGVLSKGIPPPAPVLVQQHASVPEPSQDNMYIDQSYNYAPEYQQSSQEHNYVEGWPLPAVQPPTVVSTFEFSLPHCS